MSSLHAYIHAQDRPGLEHLLVSALQKALPVLTAGEAGSLLASAWASAQHVPPAARAIILLLRAESGRVEKDHAAAVDFGRAGGIGVAVCALCDASRADDQQARLKIAAEGAAALANLVAAAGANKLAALELGAVPALLDCLERRLGAPERELDTQACRALGNLCCAPPLRQPAPPDTA